MKKVKTVRFGNWVYDSVVKVLRFENGNRCDYYEVDVEQIDSSSVMLDKIFTVAGKPWITTTDLGMFVKALDSLFTPMATLCSYGFSYKINPTDVLDKGFKETMRNVK